MEKKNRNSCYALICMVVSWGIVFAQSPFTIDDWIWGQYKIGTIPSYGGRFVGNFFEVLLTASHQQILTGIFKSLSMVFICAIFCLISGKINVRRILFFNILFLLMNIRLINDAVVWTAGFANYFLPFCFVSSIVYINQLLKKKNYNKRVNLLLKIISIIFIFLSGFFLENLSTTIIFYIISELILNAIVYRKDWFYKIISLGVSIASFVIMILHSDRFTKKGQGGYSQRSFRNFDDLLTNIKAVKVVIGRDLFDLNKLLIYLVLLLLGLFIGLVFLRLRNRKERLDTILIACQAFLIFLCPAYQLIILSPHLISIRMFFPSIMVLILIGLILFGAIEGEIKDKMFMNIIVLVLLVGSMVYPLLVFKDMAKWNANINYNNQQAIMSKKTINYSKIKPKYYRYYYCDANGPLINGNWGIAYKKYYNIPQNIQIK